MFDLPLPSICVIPTRRCQRPALAPKSAVIASLDRTMLPPEPEELTQNAPMQ